MESDMETIDQEINRLIKVRKKSGKNQQIKKYFPDFCTYRVSVSLNHLI